MRIIHLGKYYPPASGGIEGHTATLARGQAARGADVTVVVVNHADAVGNDVTFDGTRNTPDTEDRDGAVRVVRVGRTATVAKFDFTPRLLPVLRNLLRTKPDIWHLQAPNVTMMAALAVLPAVRPLVITHHSDIVRQKVLKYPFLPIEMLCYTRAAKVLSDSPPYIDGSPTLLRVRDKVETLALGIDRTPFNVPSDRALSYAATVRANYPGPIWLSVGRLIYYKALDVAFEALRSVPGTLVVVGTGPMEPAWRQKAQALGVADRVVWHGRTSEDDLVGLLHAATALWFPSNARSEGFGLVQVEAMAAGCPVINANIPHSGVPWVGRHDVAGLTVPIDDPAAFAAAAKRLLSEPGLRDRLAAGAVREAAERFDESVMVDRSLEIYRAVAG